MSCVNDGGLNMRGRFLGLDLIDISWCCCGGISSENFEI